MKEHTYGWYPPARSIWDRSKETSSYNKECLYKHRNSRYNDRVGVPTPQPPTPICAMFPPAALSASKSFRPQSRSSHRRAPQTPPQINDLAISGTRAPSVGSLRQVTTPSQKKCPSKPKKAWATQLAATMMSVPHYQPRASYAPSETLSVDRVPTTSSSRHHDRPASVLSDAPPSRRSLSATMHRQKVAPPTRPTKSAGSLRSQIQEESPAEDEEIKAVGRHAHSPPSSTIEPCPSAPRPEAPVPDEEEDEGEDVESAEGSQPDEEGPQNYEEQRAKYGWRFEIPGDPLNLKRPTLPARLPYTVKVPVPEVAPNPPTGHMMNYDTYFYNTIPRKPMSFTIHKEWISEVLHAKRMDLQKKEGTNYNYKQYAFIY